MRVCDIAQNVRASQGSVGWAVLVLKHLRTRIVTSWSTRVWQCFHSRHIANLLSIYGNSYSAVDSQNIKPQHLQELGQALHEEWLKLGEDTLHNLVNRYSEAVKGAQ